MPLPSALGTIQTTQLPTQGSLYFNGLTGGSGTNFVVNNNSSLALGSGNFTIEWFQYMLQSTTAIRIWAKGSWAADIHDIAVTIEGSENTYSFYLWINSTTPFLGINMAGTLIENIWHHFAVVRNGDTFTVYRNGVSIGTTTNSITILNTKNLRLGNLLQTNEYDLPYKGYITNFRWTPGLAIYTSNFSAPRFPLVKLTQTSLLLLSQTSATAFSDAAQTSAIASTTNTTFTTISPFKSLYAIASGTKPQLGTTDMSLLYSGNEDDNFIGVGLPFNFRFYNNNYSTAFVGTNTYITFGSGSTQYLSLSLNPAGPPLPAFHLGSGDHSWQQLWARSTSNTCRIRYVGVNSAGGFGTQIIYEITFFRQLRADDDIYVELVVGTHGKTNGPFGMTNGGTTATNFGTVSQNSSYVIILDSNGNYKNLLLGSYISVTSS